MNLDIERTKKYYDVFEDSCECSYCRNFYLTVDKYYPKLKTFLSQYGLTMSKPVEALHIFRDVTGMVHYEAWYGIARNIKRKISH